MVEVPVPRHRYSRYLVIGCSMSHCLRPLTIVNPHWNPKRVSGRVNLNRWRSLHPLQAYPEDFEITVPCNRCSGCNRDRALSWRVRLLHEHMYGNHTTCIPLTLTIAPKHLHEFKTKESQASAIRAFFDRLRHYCPERRVPKHFIVSELGEERDRLHFHGILWDVDLTERQIRNSWMYGFIRKRPFRSVRQISYVSTYITKPGHDWFFPRVYVTPGLGKGYTERTDFRAWHSSAGLDTPINYCVKFEHFTYPLPRYYREKLFSDAQISDFKECLSRPDRPFKKVLGKQTYTTEQSYNVARKTLLEVSVRKKTSKPLTTFIYESTTELLQGFSFGAEEFEI